MRSIRIIPLYRKYLTQFWKDDVLVWTVESYIIMSHEIMVEWIDCGNHPVYNYT